MQRRKRGKLWILPASWRRFVYVGSTQHVVRRQLPQIVDPISSESSRKIWCQQAEAKARKVEELLKSIEEMNAQIEEGERREDEMKKNNFKLTKELSQIRVEHVCAASKFNVLAYGSTLSFALRFSHLVNALSLSGWVQPPTKQRNAATADSK